MEAARPRTRGRRLRRGTVERPLNARLVRVGFLVVVPAILAFLFSISTTAALPRSRSTRSSMRESAASFAETLTTRLPVPSAWLGGSRGGGPVVSRDRRLTRAGDRGGRMDRGPRGSRVGRAPKHRLPSCPGDPTRRSSSLLIATTQEPKQPLGENASGTAILIELARGFAPQEVGPDPRLQHTLVLVSTDAGAFGGAGAARLRREVATRSGRYRGRRSRRPGSRPPAPGNRRRSTRCLRRARSSGPRPTASSEEVGVSPALPSVASQLVDLGVPFALDEQGRFLAAGLSAVTLTTDSDGETDSSAGRRIGSGSSGERPRRSSALSTPASVERFARPTASSSRIARRADGQRGWPHPRASSRSLSASSI